MTILGIYGASGFGREVLSLARLTGHADNQIAFIEDTPAAAMVSGIRVFNFEDFAMLPEEKLVALAIADSQVRARLVEKVADADVGFITLVAPNAVIGNSVAIGNGGIFSPFSHVTCDATIGSHFHCNIYSYVAHDCQIGNFVTFAPGVKCNGNVHIEDHAYIGTGAILRQGTPDKPLRIGRGAVVGMGAVVTKDVPAGEVWVGNPARQLTK
ncbi:acetyltransferase [Alteriqipengyuania sp. WL0013]|uniref:acetyltransferase n=1 Tax=Alteriqipengyuania sp. WL0013 TaxID=3110773 RepID=UPI002BEDB5D8|nr:acetyltransferase [Alteriqipengyuania sp. WL0013]MEB3415623.1 acetyltransferase [Alteriqipengyuania sp. WL0013]